MGVNIKPPQIIRTAFSAVHGFAEKIVSLEELSPKNTFDLPAKIKEGIFAFELSGETMKRRGVIKPSWELRVL